MPAIYYDGVSPARRDVVVTATDVTLTISARDGARVDSWPLAEVRRRPDTQGSDRLSLSRGDGLARLDVWGGEAGAALRARCPALEAPRGRRARWRPLALWAAAALAVLAGLLLVLLPALADRLAPLIPPEREAALGRAMAGQLARMTAREGAEAPFCDGAAGRAALDALAARLLAGAALPFVPELRVARSDMVNAFAAPGGQVVIFDGLLQAAAGPDELAGVLAHELGHVAARDPTRLALRAAGSAGLLGLAFGDFAGGTVVVAVANQAFSASYTRAAEAGADAYAAELLAAAGISGAGLADFFERLADEGDSAVPPLLQSHPDLAARAEAARGLAVTAPRPALPAAEWAALQAICG